MEIELKLSISATDVATFRRLPLLAHYADGAPQTERLVSTYFDTPALYLKQQRSALRVRRCANQWIQTFKGGGRVEAGLHQRHEWECPVAQAQIDLPSLLPLIDNPSARAILQQADLVSQLQPVFTTDFERTIWMLQLSSETLVELALDQGFVIAEDNGDERRVALSEIELELKHGQLDDLLAFSLALKQQLPLQASNISKAQRGFALRYPDQDSVL
jgi:triphosphatase